MSQTFDPNQAPGFADIEAASKRLAGKAVVTPLLESPALNARCGGRVLLKAETLQRTGSFKFRGAYNRLSLIPEAERAAGVVAFSSGNHAQGVAAAAQLYAIPATIVMPADAPAIKVENTRAYGAEVVLYDRNNEDRAAVAGAIAEERGATLVPPFDDSGIIAGQGTCGLEIVAQAAAADAKLDALLVCCGGGGLSAGCALALREGAPQAELYTVEPEDFDDTARSLSTGERQSIDGKGRSFCDALLSPQPGELTFAINRRLYKRGLVVSDAEVASAMIYAFLVLKLVVEPGGAAALAAILAGRIELAGRTVAATLSGGNVDAELYSRVLCATQRGNL